MIYFQQKRRKDTDSAEDTDGHVFAPVGITLVILRQQTLMRTTNADVTKTWPCNIQRYFLVVRIELCWEK